MHICEKQWTSAKFCLFTKKTPLGILEYPDILQGNVNRLLKMCSFLRVHTVCDVLNVTEEMRASKILLEAIHFLIMTTLSSWPDLTAELHLGRQSNKCDLV